MTEELAEIQGTSKSAITNFQGLAANTQFRGLEQALVAATTLPKRLVAPLAWVEHIPFAFFLTEAVKPKILVELGVHTGNSFAAFCQAAIQTKSPSRLYGVDTWEGDPHATYYDRDIFSNVSGYFNANYSNLANLLRMTFDQALSSFSEKSVDVLHIDGYHTYEAAANDFYSWLPKMSSRGVVLLHDTSVRRDDFGVWKLLEELSKKYPTFEFFHGHGLGVVWVGEDSAKLWCDLSEPKAQVVRDTFARLGAAILDLARQDITYSKNITKLENQCSLLGASSTWTSQLSFSENGHFQEALTQRAAFEDPNFCFSFLYRPEHVGKTSRLWLIDSPHGAMIKSCILKIGKESKPLELFIGQQKLTLNQAFLIEDLAIGISVNLPTLSSSDFELNPEIIIEGELQSAGSYAVLQKVSYDKAQQQVILEEKIKSSVTLKARNTVLVEENQKLISKLSDAKQSLDKTKQEQSFLSAEIASLKAELQAQMQAKDHWISEFKNIINSKSWKLTKPLRMLLKLFTR